MLTLVYINQKKLILINSESTPPTITEATVQELPNDMGQVYECVAEGQPLPIITWSAFSSAAGSLKQLANDIPGITIESMVHSTEVVSRLTISVDSDFEEPICAAENDMGRVIEAFNSIGK